MDLVFRLPDGYDIERPRGFTLRWGFRVGGREVRHETFYERRKDRAFRNPFFASRS